jgi:hypothetical protein
MNRQLKRFAISGLRCILGVAVLLESLRFAVTHSPAHLLGRVGLPLLATGVSLVSSYALPFIFPIKEAVEASHDR